MTGVGILILIADRRQGQVGAVLQLPRPVVATPPCLTAAPGTGEVHVRVEWDHLGVLRGRWGREKGEGNA